MRNLKQKFSAKVKKGGGRENKCPFYKLTLLKKYPLKNTFKCGLFGCYSAYIKVFISL